MIKFIRDQLRGPFVGAEIGVLKGINAESILKTLPMKKLFLIDPYVPYYSCKGEFLHPDESLREAKGRVARFGDKTVFLKKMSEDAVDDVPDGLDFVYVDGNHSYEFVKKDLELYYDKVRVGGVIGGHDFRLSIFGVPWAVTEFMVERGIGEESAHSWFADWWFIKNE